jgi:tetratricopeptide (TPR) repeat protein
MTDTGRRAGWTRLLRPKVALLGGCALLCGMLSFTFFARLFRPARPRAEAPARPRIDAAIAAAQEKLRSDPQDLAALVELGTLHFEKGSEQYPDAVNELEDARRLGALDARIFYCLGVMYQELGLYPFALEEYQKYLRNHPEDKEVRLLAAKLCYQLGDFAAAVKEFERLKFRYPSDPLIGENLGLSLWGAKQSERAVESFQQLKAAGGLPGRRAQFYLGQMAFESGRFSEALDLMRAVLPEPDGPDFGIPKEKMFAAVGMAHQKMGQIDEARDAWEQVLKLVPRDAKALAAVKSLRSKAGRRLLAKKSKR